MFAITPPDHSVSRTEFRRTMFYPNTVYYRRPNFPHNRTEDFSPTHKSPQIQEAQAQVNMKIARNKTRKTITFEPVIFDISPSSSPPSSPTSDRIDSFIPPDWATWSQTYVPEQTPIEQLAHSLQTAQAEPASLAVISAHTDALFRHLHNTPLSLPDVEVLVPALLYDNQVVHKIAVNIGWFYGKCRITPTDREALLTYIFVQNKFEHLFTRVHDQLERFRYLRPKQPAQRPQKQVKPVHSRWPAKYLVKEDAAWLPLGCQCIADIYIRDGLMWPQVKKIEAVARQAILDEARKTKVKKVWRAEPVAVPDPGSWAMTRTHNGSKGGAQYEVAGEGGRQAGGFGWWSGEG